MIHRVAYVVKKFVSLERVKLQVTRFPVQNQRFAARVDHQVCPDTFSCTRTEQ